ncbi:uncharacterized protein AtWU_04012 [Aspergillus tubingensis]|uniref:Uncharacterized protein n=1 Tax=Aspergillus niger TaxID=5061 RepID=A0A100I721_ASPNG|nr:uncharacterized protein AtWU_04012 [Aspergillus tubingensis]GAQ35914.1 hypothetical protein AKAW_04898 [Aspergillus niger]GFN14212.1 hypothetical protein AtWU_04012 [Aspergillus tubingensis]
MKRTVILTESPDEHLVWSPGRVLIKPVPEYLLDHKFWVRNICPNRELYAVACGLLLSYAWLIAGLIDLRIAKNEHILPSDVKCHLPALNDPSVQPQPAINNKRYEFGELRLSRLNYIYRLTPSIFSIRNLQVVLGFMPGSTWYQEFSERHFSWILAVLVYLSVLLSAMQVGLATDTLQGNRRFQKSCTVFALAFIFFTYLLLNFPDEMSSDSSQKRVVESVDDIHDTGSDGHRGKRSKIDKPFTGVSSSVRDTETSPSSLVPENKAHDVLQPKGDQAGDHSEAICSPAPQALSPKPLAPEPVQDPPQQCHNNNDKVLQSTQEDKAEYICFGMLRDVDIKIQPVLGSYSLSVDQSFGIPDTFASLTLSIKPSQSDFLSSEGACIATIEYATHRRISSIKVEEDPIWLGVIPKKKIRQKIRAVTKSFSSGSYSPSSWTYKINILAIGLSTIAKPLADQLTQPQHGRRQLQLRCPVPKPDQIRYYNPQWSYTLGPPPSEQLKPPHTPRIANQKELNGSDEAGANKRRLRR